MFRYELFAIPYVQYFGRAIKYFSFDFEYLLHTYPQTHIQLKKTYISTYNQNIHPTNAQSK